MVKSLADPAENEEPGQQKPGCYQILDTSLRPRSKSVRTGPKVKWLALLEKVFDWISVQRQNGIGLSGPSRKNERKIERMTECQ